MAGVPVGGDPFSAFASSFGGGFGSGFGKGLGDAIGGGGDAGPFIGGSSSALAYGTTLDSAGWIVNLGGQQTATASPVRTTTNTPSIGGFGEAGLPALGAPAQAGLGTVPALLLAGVVALWALKRAGR